MLGKAPFVLCMLVVSLVLANEPANAQEDREAILAKVQQFFDALEKSDTVAGEIEEQAVVFSDSVGQISEQRPHIVQES